MTELKEKAALPLCTNILESLFIESRLIAERSPIAAGLWCYIGASKLRRTPFIALLIR